MRLPNSIAASMSFCLIAIFSSCVSSPEKKFDSVYVMVYDRGNSEVMGATVFMDDEMLGNTDVYGRFLFPVNRADNRSHAVRIEKEGHETSSVKTVLRPGQLLYFRIGTGAYYATLAEEFLDKNDIGKALKMIDRALAIEGRKDWDFLKGIILGRVHE